MDSQEKAACDLERLKNGEASINDIRRENGMEPVEGADERYRAKGIKEIRIPLKIDVRPAMETATKLKESAKTARILATLIEELNQGFEVEFTYSGDEPQTDAGQTGASTPTNQSS